MSIRIFIPQDSTALALGAGRVADAIVSEAAKRSISITLVRTGSRGAYWLEPLVEIETPEGRAGFGPLAPEDVPSLFDSGFPGHAEHKTPHRRALGPIARLPWFARQTRITFARCGEIDPLDLVAYRAAGGFKGLETARALSPETVIEAVTQSGLRGRGGAGFPTGIKWRTVKEAKAPRRFVVCNADEGDSGTFADRMLMEGDPFLLIEGMMIAAHAVGAQQGFIYLRSEYPHAARTLAAALSAARKAGLLGPGAPGANHSFDIELRMGAGAYVCGEETALLESLEGKRGQVRFRPPLPAVKGLFGMPTIVNNVLSLAAVPFILSHGAEAYRSLGVQRSRGTQPVQLAGNVKRGGLIELAFGITLRELIEDFGGGTATGRPIRAVQVGGPLGAYLPVSKLDVALDYEALAAAGGLLGHGGIVVFDDQANMAEQARFAFEFCAAESCGKCTPCRIGSTRGVELIDRMVADGATAEHTELLRDLCETLTDGSLCALGGLTPLPVLSAFDHFSEDFARPRAAAE